MSVPAGWTRLIGLVGLLILVVVVAHWIVRRNGGWGALRRRIVRELTTAARAFATPVRTELRHRRGLRVLRRRLSDPSGWRDTETALRRAAAESHGTLPYAALLGGDLVGVYIAHRRGDGALPEPWVRDAADPCLWWISRSDLGVGPFDVSTGRPSVLVCLGVAGAEAMLLDLTAGPSAVSVTGAPRTARSVLQALAAQIDVRLPAGRVTVGAEVHPRHDGPADVLHRLGAGDFAVSAEPPERALPHGVRLLTLGVAHGSTLILEADRDAFLRVHGDSAARAIDVLPLARAVGRLVGVLPPVPRGEAGSGTAVPPVADGLPADDDLVEDGSGPAVAVSATAEVIVPASPARSGATITDGPDAPPPQDSDLAEPAEFGPAGISASTARPSSS